MSDEIAFGPLTISFDDRILRPREWTLAQSEWAAELMITAPGGAVLELCAGAGHIGLAAVAMTGRRLVCVDSSPVACDYARVNAHVAGMADLVEVREKRVEEALAPDERFPIIIADPPWVPHHLTREFPEDPLRAIDGGADGLDVARACLIVIADHLMPGGSAVLQLGTTAQAKKMRAESSLTDGDLVMVDVRPHERGVLVRVDRSSDAG